MNPSQPLIGHAGELLALLSVTLAKKDRHKLLFAGVPGVGKSTLAESIAQQLCGSKFGVEQVNGRSVTIHVVKEWQRDLATSCLFGSGWKVKLIDEIDLCQKDAQDELLSLLDHLPAQRAIIGTSNLNLTALTERLRTRFTRYEVRAPVAEQIETLIGDRYALPPAVARQIAALSGGNVRAACLDAEAWCPPPPQPPASPVFVQTSLAALGI
jgi:DNA polymerase III delta prime subunit